MKKANKLILISLIFYIIAIIISLLIEMPILTIIFCAGILYDIVKYIQITKKENREE